MEQATRIAAAEAEGEQANFDGLHTTENPYGNGSRLSAAWERGWLRGEEVRQQWYEAHDARGH